MEIDIHSAFQYHQRGLLDRAARIYRDILAGDPENADALHLLGLVAMQQGDPARAGELIRRAIAIHPGVAGYHANLGEAYRMVGRYEEAAGCCRVALRLQPHLPAAANILGQSLQALGQTRAAVDQFRQALRLQPDFAAAHNNLAMALYSEGNQEQAADHFRRAVQLAPTLAEAHSNLGQLLLELCRFEEALTHCREAVRLRPDFPAAHNNLGRVLHALGQPAAAKACYAEALRLNPDLAVVCNNMGQVVQEEGRLEESRAWYQRSVELQPDFVPAHCNLGTVLAEMGDFDAARRCHRAVLRLCPGHAEAYYQLAILLGGALPETDLAAMRQRVAEPGLSEDERATLHAGLAFVLDARGDYGRAAEHMHQANALCLADARRRGRGYDATDHERYIEGLIATCTPAFFERTRDFGMEAERPVFIVGLPRSGTTLIEQILARHSQVYAAGERTLVKDGFDALPRVMNLEAPALECFRRIDREAARRVAQHHLERLEELDRGAPRVVDKMPENYLYLGFLAVLFPRARFIHCRRDLRDVAVSCWMTRFSHVPWASDPEHIAARIHAYLRLMDHWRRVLPVRWLDVQYEDTVADLERVARQVVAWCGLEWQPGCLAFHEGRSAVRSASVAQVRRPIYTRAVARWKHYEQALAPLLARLD